MALTALHTDWTYGSYAGDRDSWIKFEENPILKGGGTYGLTPYWDTSIAIGYGFDLLVRSDVEINKFLADAGLGITLTEADKNLLAAGRAYVSANKAGTLSAADLKTALTYIVSHLGLNLGSEPNATKLYEVYVRNVAEKDVDKFLARYGISLVDSKERIALLSLAYNSPGLLGKGLGNALQLTDPAAARAEAWYQIRYEHVDQLWERRYAEAALFGLYDGDGAVTSDEAKSVYRMFTSHRNKMLGTGNDRTSALDTANANLRAAGFSTVVALTIEQALQAACDVLVADLRNSLNPDIANAYSKWIGSLPIFHSTDLYLDPTKGTFSEQSMA